MVNYPNTEFLNSPLNTYGSNNTSYSNSNYIILISPLTKLERAKSKVTQVSNYTYERSGEVYNPEARLEEVERTIKTLQIPYIRHSTLDQQLSQSSSAISQHLHELVDRGKLIRVGCEYVHVDSLEEFTEWQLRRLLSNMETEQERAATYQRRIEERIRMVKEFKRNGDWKSWKHKELQEEITDLMDTRDYYERKKFDIQRSFRAVFQELSRRSEDFCEKDGQGSPRNRIEAAPIVA